MQVRLHLLSILGEYVNRCPSFHYEQAHVPFDVQVNFEHPASPAEIESLREDGESLILLERFLDRGVIQVNGRLVLRLFLKNLIGVCHRLDNVCARLPRVDVNKVIIVNDQLGTLCTGIVKGGVRLLWVLPVHLLVNWGALRTGRLYVRFYGPLLVPGEPALVVLGRVDDPDELSHLRDHLVIKGRAGVDCGLGLLEERSDQLFRGPGVCCELQDGIHVLARGVHDIEKGSVDDPPQEDPGKLISQVGRGFEQLRQMLLKVELSVLVEEAPCVGTVLPEDWPGRVILRHRGVFQAVEALLQVVHCILGVHCRDDNICYQMLL